MRGKGWGDGTVREFGTDTLLYLTWIINKVLLYSTRNSTQYSDPDGKTILKRVDICIFATESLCRTAEISTTL